MADNQLLEALPVAVYTTDARGVLTFYNQAAADLWGYRPKLGATRWCGSWRLYWPDGRPLPHDECPMAVSLRERRPIRDVEAIAERPDGTRVPFLPFPTPLKDESGKVIAGISLLIDLTESKRGDLDSVRLASIVASSDDAIVSKTLDGRITSWNAGAKRIFGYDAEEMIGRPITWIIPAELHAEEKEILARLRRGERIQHFETVRVAKDGRRVEVSLTVSPLHDKFGNVVGASKIARDITERKEAERLQSLLVDELNHRVKNTLAMVQAIASQSHRHARSPADFVSNLTGRIQALAKAHTLLTESRMQGVDIGAILREQVLLGASDDSRVSCSGPGFVLPAQMAVHLALVLHELATNARKYGALSTSSGRLSVDWEVRTTGVRTLHLQWKESGGPRVTAPTRHGFGTALIEQSLRGHSGDASIQYGADGLTCTLVLPVPEEPRPMSATYVTASETAVALARHYRADMRSEFTGKRILIIEDDPLIAMNLESSLIEAGCKILGSARTIEDASALIANADFDIALLDANLGGQPVDALAIALTKRNIPFAFVTGYGREALPHGFQGALVLEKPFSDSQVLRLLETLCPRGGEIEQLRPQKA